MLKWVRTNHKYNADGSSELRYEAKGTDCVIESRKRAIPHANGVGSWWHTAYFVIRPDGTETAYITRKRAMEAVEEESR